MKFRSRLLNLATVIALLLCVALIVLWWRSYRRWDKLVSAWPAEGVGIASANGRAIVNIRWTRIANDSLATGFKSDAPQISISFNGGRVEVIAEDPLPTNSFSFYSSGFEWRTVEASPPDRLKIYVNPYGRGEVVSAIPGARPVAGDRFLRVVVPHWFLIALLAVWSVPRGGLFVFRWMNRRARHRAGHCTRCGYDLRATPDRCPECGMPSAK
ncbi:MAG: hypothetical protein H7Z14_02300 [Anaerolineae bacterium]|nr:hypothetical protein [Phycisphaerae bacterium]